MKASVAFAAAALVFLVPGIAAAQWVPAWSASPQPVWTTEFLFPTALPSTLENRSVRQVVRLGFGGQQVRIRLSNTYGTSAVRIAGAHLGRSSEGSNIQPGSSASLSFSGASAAVVPPGASILSDPVPMSVSFGEDLAISLYFAETTPIETFHWDGRATSAIGRGWQLSAVRMEVESTTTTRLFLSEVLVDSLGALGTVVVLGDSITDGAGASLDADTRWPDLLAARAAPRRIAVVNAGISGARLLGDRMGTNALARLDRDVLAQPQIRTVILMIGINDIAWPGTPFAPHEPLPSYEALTAGYRQIVERARTNGVRVIGATLTPFAGALPGTPLQNTYYTREKDELRVRINEWIRTSGTFDAVVDFDLILRDPQNPVTLLGRYDSGDRLHPGDLGNQAMANAVDLDALLSE